MPLTMKVECPRCHKIWAVPEGTESFNCNCHEYCEDGNKPQDCTLIAADNASVPDRWTGQWNYPQGMHLSRNYNGDDVRARIKYCTVHSKFVTKVPIIIDCPWETWQTSHISDDMKWHKGVM